MRLPERMRRLAVHGGLFSLAALTLMLLPTVAWASHSGPISVVAATSLPDEDRDGDRHFKTLQAALQGPPALQAYDTIFVEPGRYPGDLEIRTEGLILRSTGGASQTVLTGRIFIYARNVRVEGFSVESGPPGPAVTIAAAGVHLQGNRIYGSVNGVLIEGAYEVTLLENQIYNHTRDGLVARDAWNLQFARNEVRGNGGLGVWVENSRDLLLEKNSLTFNQLGGLWLKGSQRARLLENTVRDNKLVGIVLEETSESHVEANQLTSNEAGLLLINAINNQVTVNEIRQHHVAGMVLKNGAQGNSIEKNIVQGNQGRGGTGVRLAGNVFSNRFVQNHVSENGIGLVLSANETGGPANNAFEINEIAHSDRAGVSIEAGSKQNRFIANVIHQNLEVGLTSAGEANIYEKNEVHSNGGAGLSLQGARSDRLEGNRIYQNGAAGMLLESATNLLVAKNEVRENVGEGLYIRAGRRLRFVQNTIVGNGASGLLAQDMETASFANNRIRENRDYGVHLAVGRGLVLEENSVQGNGLGGVRLEGIAGADFAANHVTGNLHYGLLVLNSESISARRNFWGDGHGPAGAFAGRGNAVVGLSLEEVTPWLPAEPDELVLRSVSALMIDSPQGPRIEFDASDRLGLILELFEAGRGEPGRTLLLSPGIVIAARYASRPPGVPPLGAEIQFYALTVEGMDAGTAELTVFYGEEDQPRGLEPEKVQLFVLEDGRWQPLPGRADPQLRRITGEIRIDQLDGRLIGVGMFTEQLELNSSSLPWGENGSSSKPRWLSSSMLLLAPVTLIFFYLFYMPHSRRYWSARTEAPLGFFFRGSRR
jgi:parallel beta-helix repeat protein